MYRQGGGDNPLINCQKDPISQMHLSTKAVLLFDNNVDNIAGPYYWRVCKSWVLYSQSHCAGACYRHISTIQVCMTNQNKSSLSLSTCIKTPSYLKSYNSSGQFYVHICMLQRIALPAPYQGTHTFLCSPDNGWGDKHHVVYDGALWTASQLRPQGHSYLSEPCKKYIVIYSNRYRYLQEPYKQ